MGKHEIKEYVDIMVRYLNPPQMLTVLWWNTFHPKKRNNLIRRMKDGVSVKIAFKEIKDDK